MIDLTVKTLDSQNHAFSIEDDQITVRGFKEYIAESVAVPADSQRLIYCGRVLQDEKKLNDYDVNGKVIHLVQRAPPQPGQRRNDGGQGQGQNTQRPQHRGPRGHPLGSTMYFGTMSVPADFLEGHGLPVVQLSNSLSNSRLVVARRMLDSANELMDRLDDPNCPINPPSSENNQPPVAQQVPDLEAEQDSNPDGRSNGAARLIEATVAAITAALSAAGANNVAVVRGTDGTATRPATVIMEDNQLRAEHPESQQQQQDLHQQEQESQQRQQQQSQSESETSTSNSNGQSRRTTQLPRPPQMAELLGRLLNTQDRLRPYLEHYRVLMLADPSLPPGPGPEGAEENQRIVNGVSESLHYMAHACHALSDIIVNMEQQPPRNLRCRPIIIQHSAILQPGIPVQLEAHISLLGRSAAENSNEESSDTANAAAQSEANATDTESNNQQQGTEGVNQQQHQPQPPPPQPQRQSQQESVQSPFGTVFNLPNNVEVLMEVTPDGNLETAAGNEQSQTGENNNNNNNAGRTNGSGTFPWRSSSPPDFVRLMQTLAGHVLQRGISTTVPTRNPPSTLGAHQPPSTTIDSGNTNAGQSTQARSNVGTHPTTATQTRSTPRLHRVFQPQTHPLGVGMNVDSDLEFDLFLPCYSHHIFRPPPNTPNNVNVTSQGSRANQSTVPDVQTQAQTATTSTSADNSTTTSTPPPATSQANANNFANGSQQSNISLNNITSLLGDSTGSIMEMLVNGNVHLAVMGDRGASTANGGLTFTNLLRSRGVAMNLLTSDEANFLYNLPILVVQNMTLEGLMRLRIGDSEPIAQLRRPLQEFFQYSFPNSTPDELQEQATDRLLIQLRPHLDSLIATEEEVSGRSGSRIDICATIQSLLRQHIKDMLRILFSNDIDDAAFGQEMLNIVNNLARQLCAVLRYSIRGGQAGLEAVASRFATEMLDGVFPAVRQQLFNNFIVRFRAYSLRITQPPDSEILPLLIYKDVQSQASAVPSAPPQPPQAQSEVQPMETEVAEEKASYETSMQDDGEEVPETFPGHEALPSDWVPIIARDGVRQRRQFQMQGMANGGVTAFSDAYLGALPTKRRKLIEQQKTRLLVSPTPNHSAIAASMERLVREGVSRAGVEEVEGAAVAVAGDSGVRRAFGQAIRDCLNPRRYGMPDFPDPLRFPNATKYFADQDRPPK